MITLLASAACATGLLAAEGGARRVLRVAADPNNLPFSNQRLEGFENRIAELIAHELEADLSYVWWPQRRGFFRETLGAGRADIVIGVPAGFERVLTTRAYYRSTYVFVFPAGMPPLSSIEDPRLRRLRIGVQLAGDDGANTPPAHALSARGIVNNVRGYTLYGDYSHDSPPAAIIHAVADGEVDVAIAWGPMAGYFTPREKAPLALAPVAPCDCVLTPFQFSIAVGVRKGEKALRDEIDAVLVRRRDVIDRILDDYGVPRVGPPPARKEEQHAQIP